MMLYFVANGLTLWPLVQLCFLFSFSKTTYCVFFVYLQPFHIQLPIDENLKLKDNLVQLEVV